MKYKIIWIIDSLGPGGAENLTLAILKHFDKEKFDLRVCVLQIRQGNPIAKELEQIGIPVDLVSVPVLRHPANLPNLVKYLRQKKPALIHTQLGFADILGSLAAKIIGIPCVSTLHIVGLPQKGTSEFWRTQLWWTCLRYFCDRVISVSENTRQFYIQTGRLPKEKIITLYNGIDLSIYEIKDKKKLLKKREALMIQPNKAVLITVAVLREQKGIQYMLEALPIILESMQEICYLVVGDGEYSNALKDFVSAKNLDKYVVFAGQRSDIPDLLAISDIFVLPTLTEALPTVLIEAMAAKKAIVASKVGGIPEMISDGVNGLLIAPAAPKILAEACLNLLKNNKTKDAMAAAGIKIAKERFDIHTQVKMLSNLYEELIKNGQ